MVFGQAVKGALCGSLAESCLLADRRFPPSTIQAHRGKIWVESDPNERSRFTFLLPMDQG